MLEAFVRRLHMCQECGEIENVFALSLSVLSNIRCRSLRFEAHHAYLDNTYEVGALYQ